MSDQLDGQVQDRPVTPEQEDPLAELARIVSGDGSAVVQPQPVSDTPGFDDSLEAELMRELGGGEPQPAAPGIPIQSVSGPDEVFQDELLAALELETPAAEAIVDTPTLTEPSVSEAPVAIDETIQDAPDPLVIEESIPTHEPTIAEQPAPTGPIDTGFDDEFNRLIAEDLGGEPIAATVESVEDALPENAYSELDKIQASLDQTGQEIGIQSERKELPDGDALEEEFSAAFADELEVVQADTGNDWQPETSVESGTVIADDIYHEDFAPQTAVEADLSGDEFVEEKSSGNLKYAVVALVLALVSGLGVAGYGFFGPNEGGVGNGEPVLIKADSDPVKVKPENPGGRVVENQDKASYSEVDGNSPSGVDQEVLVSKTEEPADLGTPAVNESKGDERLESQDEQPKQDTDVAGIVPRKVKTLTVKPDGTIVMVDAEPTVTTASEVIPEVVEIETVKPVELAAIDGAQSSGKIKVPEASPLPKPKAAEPKPVVSSDPKPVEQPTTQTTQTPAVTKSEYVVQVSSQRSAEAAQASYQNLKSRFPGVFSGRSIAVKRANIEGKGTFYRVRVQAASKADAGNFCAQLKSAGGSCFVTR